MIDGNGEELRSVAWQLSWQFGSRAERKIKNKMHLQPKKNTKLIYKALETMKTIVCKLCA